MSNQFLGEIRIFPFNFAPPGWALCNGQIVPLSQNTALYSLLGTYYGGDGKSNFALPNLQGCVPISQGQSPGTSAYSLGETAGSENVTLLEAEMPAHAHAVTGDVSQPDATQGSPRGNVFGAPAGKKIYSAAAKPAALMSPHMVSVAGGDRPHNNVMPYLVVNYCIALQGIFPQRS